MSRKTKRDQGAPSPQPGWKPATVRVAYHDGPEWLSFAGRGWRRGVAQEVARAELASMTRRAGWVVFGFRECGT